MTGGKAVGSHSGTPPSMPKGNAGLLFGGFLLLMVVTVASCGGSRVNPGAPVELFSETMGRRLPDLLKKFDVPGLAISVIRDGRVVWSEAYGYADPATDRIMTVETTCRAESISKSVTAWGVMNLVEERSIQLDDPVARYVDLGFLDPSGHDASQLTLEALLSHTGGLPLGTIGPSTEYEPGSETPPLIEFPAKDARLVDSPGKAFAYSDAGFNLLELIVQQATGVDYAEYMAEEILLPLGMKDSSFDWQPEYKNTLATGHELDGTPVCPYVYPARASGGLFSDVRDLARFVIAGIKGGEGEGAGVLSRDSIDTLYRPRVAIPGLFSVVADHFGYGHFIETLPGGSSAVWHGGQGHGWMTHFHLVPETGDGIVLFANSQRSWPLIAEILSMWSHWAAICAVKFSRLAGLQRMARLLVVVLLARTVFQGVRVARDGMRGRRRVYLVSRTRGVQQVLLALSGVSTVAWMAVTLAVVSQSLLATDIFPKNDSLQTPQASSSGSLRQKS